MLKRRDLFKVITPVVVAAILQQDIDWTGVLLAAPSTPDSYDFKTPFYHLGLSRIAPQIMALCLDSLGKGKLSVNPILPQQVRANRAWQVTRNDHSIAYSMKSNGSPTKDGWTFEFASATVQHAAHEFAVDLHHISGADFPVTSKQPGWPAIYVGPGKALRAAFPKLALNSLPAEGFSA